MSRITLLSAASATGSAAPWVGGRGTFSAAGTFGGGTVKLQFLGPDGATWIDAGAYTTLTVAGGGVFNLPTGSIRAAVSGGTPSGIYAVVDRVTS